MPKKKEVTPKISKVKSTKAPVTIEEPQKKSTIPLKHVLPLDDKYYITCNSLTFILKEYVDKVDKDGKKLQDLNIAYCQSYGDILKTTVDRMIRVPNNYKQLDEKLDKIYKLIDERIPLNSKPSDMFKDIKTITVEDEE